MSVVSIMTLVVFSSIMRVISHGRYTNTVQKNKEGQLLAGTLFFFFESSFIIWTTVHVVENLVNPMYLAYCVRLLFIFTVLSMYRTTCYRDFTLFVLNFCCAIRIQYCLLAVRFAILLSNMLFTSIMVILSALRDLFNDKV